MFGVSLEWGGILATLCCKLISLEKIFHARGTFRRPPAMPLHRAVTCAWQTVVPGRFHSSI
ncbi:hypothetical protein E0E52_19635 [Azotobacter chroococcum]|nr:hypothetical protein E0E52_19635 [Azotobacter chroococcum]